MRLRDIPYSEVGNLLAEGRLGLSTGPFSYLIRGDDAAITDGLYRLYGDFKIEIDPTFCGIPITFEKVSHSYERALSISKVWTGQLLAHDKCKADLIFASLEWAMNYAVVYFEQRWIIFHAAVLQKGDRTIVISAQSGGGKSTLSTALAAMGWRLLSDEFAVIDPDDLLARPICRPISLKAESIGVARAWFPDADFGPLCMTESKGLVAHMRPLTEWVDRIDELARINRFIFVNYQAGASTAVEAVPKAQALVELAHGSASYDTLRETAFNGIADILQDSPCIRLNYSNLAEIIPLIESDEIFETSFFSEEEAPETS